MIRSRRVGHKFSGDWDIASAESELVCRDMERDLQLSHILSPDRWGLVMLSSLTIDTEYTAAGTSGSNMNNW